MLVCDEHKFVFLRNPKTASRSMTRALSSKFECRRVALYHAWKIPKEFLGYFAFATVRDPYTRSISAWKHNQRVLKDPNYSFENFAKEMSEQFSFDPKYPEGRQWKLQSELLDKIETDVHLLRFESLEEDINSLPFIDSIELDHVGVGNYGDWKQYYTPEVETRIYETLKPDFERFGYKRWYFDREQIVLL